MAKNIRKINFSPYVYMASDGSFCSMSVNVFNNTTKPIQIKILYHQSMSDKNNKLLHFRQQILSGKMILRSFKDMVVLNAQNT